LESPHTGAKLFTGTVNGKDATLCDTPTVSFDVAVTEVVIEFDTVAVIELPTLLATVLIEVSHLSLSMSTTLSLLMVEEHASFAVNGDKDSLPFM